MVAAATALVGTSAGYLYRKRTRAETLPAQSDRNVNLDIGGTVEVKAWDPQGCTQVQYRGALWQARFVGLGAPQAGQFRIKSLNGNQLELESAS